MSKRPSIQITHPALAEKWHKTKNLHLDISDISFGSTKKVWWQCPVNSDHVYLQTPNKLSSGRGCPCCSGHQVVPSNSLAIRCPDLLKEWDYTANGTLSPKDIYWRTHKKIYWQCDKYDDHQYEMQVHKRSSEGAKCPFCGGARVAPSTSLKGLYPEIAKSWHPTKNIKKACEIPPKSNALGYWKCLNYLSGDNYWKATPNSRTKTENPICPFCSGKKLAYGGENSIHKLHTEICSDYSSNNSKSEKEITSYSRARKYKWKCKEGHEYQMSVNHRLNGHGCSICSGKIVTKETSLQFCFPDVCEEFDNERNHLRSNQIAPGSTAKVSWVCKQNKDHIWIASPNNRTKSNNPTGCPGCSSERLIQESKLFERLNEEFPSEEILRQFTPIWLRRQHVDIFFPKHNIAIEYNGEQHYKPIEHWGGKQAYYVTLERDERKARLCDKNDCKLFVVKFDDCDEKRVKLVNSIRQLMLLD